MSWRWASLGAAALCAALAGCIEQVSGGGPPTSTGETSTVSLGGGGGGGGGDGGGGAPASCAEGKGWSVLGDPFVAPRRVRARPAGDFLVAGNFAGTLAFGDGPAITSEPTSVFLARLDAAGQPSQIAQRDWGGIVDMAIGAAGDVALLVSGDVTDFGAGPIGSPGSNLFLVKLDPSGALAWSRAFPMGSDWAIGFHVDIGDAGEIVLGGWFADTIDLGSGPLVGPPKGVAADAVVVKVGANGEVLYARQLVGTSYCHVVALGHDAAGEVLAVGYFQDSITAGATTLDAPGSWAGFAVKLDQTGAPLWFQGYPLAELSGAVMTADGAAFLTGSDEPAESGGGSLLTEGGSFVAALDAGGQLVWSHDFPGLSPDGVALSPDGGVIVSDPSMSLLRLDANGEVRCSATATPPLSGKSFSTVAVNAAGDALAVSFLVGGYDADAFGLGVLTLPH